MENTTNYCEITKEISEFTEKCVKNMQIDAELYGKYEVKRGLRDISGKGVLAGLTRIAEVKAYTIDDGEMIPCEGKLYYHGYDIEKIVDGFVSEGRHGFEEITYLLLFGELPTAEQLKVFNEQLVKYRDLPTSFTRDVILKAPSKDMMNSLARSVLTLYSYDELAEDISIENVMRQSLQLIARFPRLCMYGYQAYKHYYEDHSLFIHAPLPELSTAENVLYMLRPDNKYSEYEAKVLDIALVLHADHGGGNNSTFTTRVVTSSGTDTYSTVAAAIGSLKGPKHGGANIKVSMMFDDLKKSVANWNDETAVEQYLVDLLDKKAFDRSGLIYGMGHAVYSLSDPRATIFKQYVERLSRDKGMEDEFALYSMVERLAPQVIGEKTKMYKGVSTNVDFYSGLVYKMLDLPEEIFTPIFAIARISGWCAHRIEELIGGGKIIRPAYKTVGKHREYAPLTER
ncbi:MAG: citrate/2-methylcitrate synthase [Oscillospiraceae bacterium]|jgi:citrate synthase|nr:citrate/2-methylcitrate synthase [Oscillospiraceae bacterium]